VAVSIGGPPKEVEFKRVEKMPSTKITLTVDGLPKTRKTTFALTAPGPICFHNFDFGLNGVVDPFLEKKEIYSFDYPFQSTMKLPGSEWASMSEGAGKLWTEFVKNYRASLEQMRTVVVDTGTKAWELIRLARLGKLTQVMPLQYTAVNQEFQDLLSLGQRSAANVLWIHRLKPEYVDDKQTGNHIRTGFGDIAFEVDAVIRMSADPNVQGSDTFRAKIGTCRQKLLQGVELIGDNITFPNVAKLMLPEVDEKNWL
jgi:hypothetical protein